MIIKSASKKMNTKNKTCKKFCKKVFLPEREKVDLEFKFIHCFNIKCYMFMQTHKKNEFKRMKTT